MTMVGRWARLSLAEQLANVGSEVGRMVRWQGHDERLMRGAIERALELLDLTLADPSSRSGCWLGAAADPPGCEV